MIAGVYYMYLFGNNACIHEQQFFHNESASGGFNYKCFCNGHRSSWRLLTVSVDRLVELVLMRDKSCLEEGTEHTRVWRGNQHMHMLRVLVVNKSADKSVQGQRES